MLLFNWSCIFNSIILDASGKWILSEENKCFVLFIWFVFWNAWYFFPVLFLVAVFMCLSKTKCSWECYPRVPYANVKTTDQSTPLLSDSKASWDWPSDRKWTSCGREMEGSSGVRPVTLPGLQCPVSRPKAPACLVLRLCFLKTGQDMSVPPERSIVAMAMTGPATEHWIALGLKLSWIRSYVSPLFLTNFTYFTFHSI